MRFGSFFLPFLAASALSAQTTTPSPQQPVPPSSPGNVFTLKAGAKRVLVDVVVKDRSGRPIHGLKASDFQVEENGQPQQVHDFDEHASATALSPTTPKFPRLPQGEFTNFVPVPQSAALNVVLIDRLNTAQTDQVYLQQQFAEYLKHARPDSRTAVYGLTEHLLLLQPFTSNPATLLAALNANSNTVASPLRDNSFGHVPSEDLSSVTDMLGRFPGPDAGQLIQAVRDFQTQYQSVQGQIQGKITLDALNQIARSLAGVPGRKNLIWFTGNFPSSLFPGSDSNKIISAQNIGDRNVDQQFAGLETEYRETVNLLTAAQIAIYPIDAQGLRTIQSNGAAVANHQYAARSIATPTGSISGAAYENEDIGNELAQGAAEHIGMERIAKETGGEAFFNTNDLAHSVDSAVDTGSNFYTLAYIPTNSSKSPSLRSISVKINGQKYSLSYRRSYYADTDAPKPARSPLHLASAVAPTSPALTRALSRTAPEPTEILLRVRATPVDHGGDTDVTGGNQVNPNTAVSHGPYQQFQVGFAASPHGLSFRRGDDNRYRSDIDFVTFVYDSEGALVNTQSNTFRASYSAQQVADVMRSGIPFAQLISVPQKGTYSLRVAVHDNVSDKVGAVEIPVSSLRELPLTPMDQPTEPPADAPAPRQ